MERKLAPYDQAYQEIPENWHEKLGLKGVYMTMLISQLLTILVYKDVLRTNALEPHLVGAFIYIIGSVADMISTAKALDVSKKAEEIEMGSMIEEGNPFLNKVRFSAELYHNPRTWLINGIGLIIGTAVAPLGVALGITKGYAAMNNFRLGNREKRAIELTMLERSSVQEIGQNRVNLA